FNKNLFIDKNVRMRTLLYLLTILLLIGCEKVENLVTPDKYKSKKDYPKGYALIDVELFMKKGTRVEYSSPNKKVVGEYDIMTLLIVKDTLKHGDFVNVSFFSRDYENS